MEKYTQLELLTTRDLHVHTPYCLHADGPMEDYVLAAIDQGLEEIGFLAHAEAGINSKRKLWLDEEDLDIYWEEARELRDRYRGCIAVSAGLELGLNPDALPALEEIINRHRWDRIGLSYHHLPDGEKRLNICSRAGIPRLREVNALEMSLRYYRDLRDGIRIFRPQMICHLDVVRKFMEDQSHHPRVRSAIMDVLWAMQKENVMLEVNTAGYDYVAAPYPLPWIIREAVDMGIDLVLSSDSHKPEHVARHFDRATQYIGSALFAGLIPQRRCCGG